MQKDDAPPISPDGPGAWQVGDLLVDARLERVTREGVELMLPHLSFALLLALVRSAPGLVSTPTLMELVWPSLVVNPETVAQRVKLLRQALGDDTRSPRYIAGIRGKGYRIVANVTSCAATDAVEPAGVDVTSERAPVDADAKAPRRSLVGWPIRSVLAGAAIVVLVAIMTGSLLPGPPPAAVPGSRAPPALSIAVLPFRDLSPTQDQAWFADGISEELGALLARIEDLVVINANSAFQFRDQEQDLQAIRTALQAEYVLTGSLRRTSDDLRLTVAVSNTGSGDQVWSHTYESRMQDVITVQEEIAEAVSRALQVTLATGTFGDTPGMTRNPEAYEQYLQGKALFTQNNSANLRQPLHHLERALVLDPAFSAASLEIHFYYTNFIAFLAPAADFPEREVRMAEALAHIHAVDPEDPNLLLIAGMDDVGKGRWLSAESKLSAAMDAQAKRLGIDRDILFFNWAMFYQDTGRIREAAPLLERARARDPLNPITNGVLADVLAIGGNTRGALAMLDAALAVPQLRDDVFLNGNRLLTLMNARDPAMLDEVDGRVASFDPGLPTYPPPNSQMIANRRDPERALQLLREYAQEPGITAQTLGVMAAWAAFFNEPEFALELLERRRKITQVYLGWFVARPLYSEVRKLEGFKQFVTALGLVEYWRESGNWGDYCRPMPDPDTEGDFYCF